MKEKPIYEQLGYDPDPPFYAQTSKPIVTNYDRLIGKSPEELAEWIETIANCDSCQHSWSLGKCRGGDGTTHAACRLKWLDWLKQEAV